MGPPNTILVTRSVIGALFAALAVANFVTGRIAFGVLFAALAVMNVVMTAAGGPGSLGGPGVSPTATTVSRSPRANRGPCCRTS